MDTRKLGAPLSIEVDREFLRYRETLRENAVPIYFVVTHQQGLGNFDRRLFCLSRAPRGNDDHCSHDEVRDIDQRGLGHLIDSAADAYVKGVRHRLEQLANVTGGRVMYFSLEEIRGNPNALVDMNLAALIDLPLGLSYQLEYSPPSSDKAIRNVRVQARNERFRILQSRSTYTVP